MSRLLWWRDDDAGRDHPNLARLLDLAASRQLPVALAVVPAWLEPAAAARIRACPEATVLQHGINHSDHARPGAKRLELGGRADRAHLVAGLIAGRQRLEDAFGSRFLPVLVPPWNRIDADLEARLPELGYRGLSRFAGPVRAGPPRRVDTHLDIVDWRAGRRQRAAADLDAALADGLAHGPSPLGILTHHLVVDDAGWPDLDRLLSVRDHPARARFAAAGELFDVPERPTA